MSSVPANRRLRRSRKSHGSIAHVMKKRRIRRVGIRSLPGTSVHKSCTIVASYAQRCASDLLRADDTRVSRPKGTRRQFTPTRRAISTCVVRARSGSRIVRAPAARRERNAERRACGPRLGRSSLDRARRAARTRLLPARAASTRTDSAIARASTYRPCAIARRARIVRASSAVAVPGERVLRATSAACIARARIAFPLRSDACDVRNGSDHATAFRRAEARRERRRTFDPRVGSAPSRAESLGACRK